MTRHAELPPRPVLQGKLATLRPPIPADKHDRMAWGRDPEAIRMYGGDWGNHAPLTREGVERWYAGVSADPHQWVIEAGGVCVGVARLHSLDQSNRRARYAIGIFTPTWWNRGIGTEATRLVLGYAFEELRLHRVDLRVLTYNQRAIACYEKCGFVREGIERDAALVAGEWQSDVIMSILEREYRDASRDW